jgi:hypothetical protein
MIERSQPACHVVALGILHGSKPDFQPPVESRRHHSLRGGGYAQSPPPAPTPGTRGLYAIDLSPARCLSPSPITAAGYA